MAKQTRGSPAVRKVRERNSSMSGQNTVSNDGPARRVKRKASPDRMTLNKRMRVSETEHPNTSVEEVSVRRVKRKVREDGEGLYKKMVKRRRLDTVKYDQEVASSSTDTRRESCNTSVEDVSKRGVKRKAAATNAEGPKRKRKSPEDLSVEALTAEFEAKYEELTPLGKGGCASVFAGYRKADHLPVAIKHIEKDKVYCKHTDENGKEVSVEVAVMLKLAAATNGSVGTSAPVSLLDWYDLDQELILVLERPVPSMDLFMYAQLNGGSLEEEEAKIILKQLLDAAIELQDMHIFHRDIKVENILIETSSDVPRVHIIDFGLSCFVKKRSFYRVYYGTTAHCPPEWCSHSMYRAGPTTVWQLGVVLFETLHSYAIFRSTEFLSGELTISTELSEDCQDFLETCLTEDPKQRVTLKQLKRHPWLR